MTHGGDTSMCKEAFSKRLVQLRMAKGVSARDMSLSLGQNPGYINSIENNKTFPSMSNFFEICDYLNITPMEFFDLESAHPEKSAPSQSNSSALMLPSLIVSFVL